jgi:hypothetical protein
MPSSTTKPPAYSPTVTGRLPAPPPVVVFGWGKCLLIGGVLCAVILGVAFFMRWQLQDSDKKHAAEIAALRKDLGGKVDTAVAKQDATAGLVQSVVAAVNTLTANGTLTPAQAAAIGAATAANQAVKGGVKAQAGTTPGIPGSRSGGGMSVTPGTVGPGGTRGNTVVASPGAPHSSTAGCLLTIESGVLKIDGTVCPP